MNYQSFDHWLRKIREAWVDKKPEILGEICTEDVEYHESPFGEPLRGKKSVIKEWESVPLTQKDIRFDYDIIHVDESIGIAHWTATFTRIPSNLTDTLDGVFVVQLNDQGLCTLFRMWWVVKP
jgi:hypothetical protein